MDTFYDIVAQRLRDPATCSAILQVEAGVNAEAAVEMLTLGYDVSALVTPLSDTAATPAGGSLIVSQTETETFGVTMALVFPGGFSQFVVARDQIKHRLRGWLPPGAATPVHYAGGATLQYSAQKDGGRWLHLLRFRLTRQESYEAQL